MSSRELEAQKLQKDWSENARWRGIKRGYGAEDVIKLRGSEVARAEVLPRFMMALNTGGVLHMIWSSDRSDWLQVSCSAN